MLEQLLIFTRGGLVLWTWRALGNALKGSPIDALIRSCLLEEGSGDASYQYVAAGAAYTLKWVFDNELGLVIVAVYEQILHLSYVDELLARVKCEFARIYDPKHTSYADFDSTFRQLLKEAETRAEDINNMKQQEKSVEVLVQKRGQTASTRAGSQGNKGKSSSKSESKADAGEEDAHTMDSKLLPLSNGLTNGTQNGNSKVHMQPLCEDISNEDIDAPKLTEVASNVNKLHNLRARPTKKSRSASKPLNEVQRKKKAKKSQVWDDAPQHSKLEVTDPASDRRVENVAVLSGQGKNMMDKDEHSSSESEIKEGDVQRSSNLKKNRWFSSIFQSVAGKAALGRSDLDLPLKALKNRLMMKNVAEEIAEKVCESVAISLEGKRLGSVTQISSTVQAAMEEALLHILIPKRSVDILSDVHAAREKSRPYIVVFVGVNGVGKSADLAKVAYWLLQHDLHVMMASCDTVRSGAVEQLRTHAERLQIPLFEKGYEREPAIVAKEAIEEANHNNSDVVLVDIAGGMQDDEPLMRALSKVIDLNQPDLVLFVGEALVGNGNDVVDHLTKSNKKLAELGNPGLIDGILLTKFDATDDKVGPALSMAYALGAPVMFVGCGQSYADLKKFNVRSIVKVLLK